MCWKKAQNVKFFRFPFIWFNFFRFWLVLTTWNHLRLFKVLSVFLLEVVCNELKSRDRDQGNMKRESAYFLICANKCCYFTSLCWITVLFDDFQFNHAYNRSSVMFFGTTSSHRNFWQHKNDLAFFFQSEIFSFSWNFFLPETALNWLVTSWDCLKKLFRSPISSFWFNKLCYATENFHLKLFPIVIFSARTLPLH